MRIRQQLERRWKVRDLLAYWVACQAANDDINPASSSVYYTQQLMEWSGISCAQRSNPTTTSTWDRQALSAMPSVFHWQAGMVATRLSRAPPPHWHDPCQLDGWSEVTVKDVDRLIWSCPPPCWRLLSMSWHHSSAGWQTRHLISPSYSSLSSSLQSQKLQWQNAALANTCDRLEPITSYVILFDTTFAVIE